MDTGRSHPGVTERPRRVGDRLPGEPVIPRLGSSAIVVLLYVGFVDRDSVCTCCAWPQGEAHTGAMLCAHDPDVGAVVHDQPDRAVSR